MTKRSFPLVVLLAVAVLAPLHLLAAQNNIVLTVVVPQWREDALENPEIFAPFEAAHPGVDVVLAPSSNNTFFTPAAYDLESHLNGAFEYAAEADVLYVSNDNLSIEATLAGAFLDLSPLAAGDPDLNPEDFFPGAYESFQWDRGLWALPVSMDVQILIYNPAAFDAAGLAYPDEGWTLDDFARADRELTTYDDEGNVTRPGMATFGANTYLLRSLLSHGFYDPTTSPQQPKFSDADTQALLASWTEYQKEGLLGGAEINEAFDFNTVPILISTPWMLNQNFVQSNAGPKAGALLPGGTAGLRVDGFAVSGGTQQPELAYELVKYLTSNVNVVSGFFGTSPARRSLIGAEPTSEDQVFFRPEFSPETQALIDRALENAIPISELRFYNYIDRIINLVVQDEQDLNVAISTIEAEAAENLQTAAARRSNTVVMVATPIPTPVLSAGEIALKFGVTSFISPLPNQEQWNQAIADFTASDPHVKQIILDVEFAPSLTQMAEQFDCFYLPFNMTNSDDLNAVLSLDPFLDADFNFDAGDIVGNVLAQLERDNRVWGYPLHLQPQVLWYNSQLFADSGVPAPENGWTSDAFTDALRSLKIDSDDEIPFQPREFGGNYILMLAAAYGGLPLDYRTDPVTINFTDPTTVEALRQVLDLAKGGYIQYNQLANLGGGGFGGGGSSQIPIYNETLTQFSFSRFQFEGGNAQQDPYRITGYPSGSQYTPVTYDIGTAYISATSAAPEACYRWISSLAERPVLFSAMPAHRSQLDSPELMTALGVDLSDFYMQFEQQLRAPNVIEFPSAFSGGNFSPGDYITQFWLNRALDRYVLEDGDLDTELADAEMYAKEYQTCAANIPPFDPAAFSNQREQVRYFQQFIDCATSVDPSLEEVFPDLPETD
jgi:ABC-type glycerol-3-phosphate transport system substrate-binding protein